MGRARWPTGAATACWRARRTGGSGCSRCCSCAVSARCYRSVVGGPLVPARCCRPRWPCGCWPRRPATVPTTGPRSASGWRSSGPTAAQHPATGAPTLHGIEALARRSGRSTKTVAQTLMAARAHRRVQAAALHVGTQRLPEAVSRAIAPCTVGRLCGLRQSQRAARRWPCWGSARDRACRPVRTAPGRACDHPLKPRQQTLPVHLRQRGDAMPSGARTGPSAKQMQILSPG